MISIFVNNKTSANKIVSKKGNQVTVYFNPPILLEKNKDYQLRCLNASIVYCMPNIFTGVNNKLHYFIDGVMQPSSFRTITFDNGLYSLRDINRTISYYTTDPSHGNNSKLIQFVADQATSKIYVIFDQANTCISMAYTDTILVLLGFTKEQSDETFSYTIGNLLLKGNIKSAQQAQLNSLQNILITCDAITGSYENSQLADIIASVTPNTSPYSTIYYSPWHPLRLPLNINRISQMTFSLLNQDGEAIDMGTDNGNQPPELWSLCVDISPADMARIL